MDGVKSDVNTSYKVTTNCLSLNLKLNSMKNLIFFSILSLVLTVTSCSPDLTPFSEDIRAKAKLDEGTLKKVQFYLSKDVVIQREAGEGTTEVKGGKIKVVDGKRVEEIIIPEGTPGVLIMMPQTNRMAVSFEADSDQKFLMFGPNPNQHNNYTLLSKEWKNGVGTITYDGKEYNTNSESGRAVLMVDADFIRKLDVDSRKAKGRKID